MTFTKSILHLVLCQSGRLELWLVFYRSPVIQLHLTYPTLALNNSVVLGSHADQLVVMVTLNKYKTKEMICLENSFYLMECEVNNANLD